jgi:hypothetical protein
MGRPAFFCEGIYGETRMIKPLAICFAAALTMGLGSASARDVHGTTNSTIGSKGASTGTNGTLHSTANRALRGTAGSERSVNGTANSTIGSSGAATGTNGTLHSTTNRALNSAK